MVFRNIYFLAPWERGQENLQREVKPYFLRVEINKFHSHWCAASLSTKNPSS